MQTAKQNDLPPITYNSRGEVIPQPGEIWKDRDGHHNFILETYEDDGEMVAHTLVLETGAHWQREPSSSWEQSQVDGLPYYRQLVG